MDENVRGERKPLYETGCHWAILLGPLLLTFLGVLSLSQGRAALVVIAFGVLWILTSLHYLTKLEIALTDNEVVVRPGLPWMKSRQLKFADVIAFDFYQPSLGSMLNFGKVIIVDKQKKKYIYRFVAAPAQLVQEAHQRIMAQRASESSIETGKI